MAQSSQRMAPNHIHFSLFGPSFATRLITNMYFPRATRCSRSDPIFNSVPDAGARNRLVARFDIETTVPEIALGYQFDMVLRRSLRDARDAP